MPAMVQPSEERNQVCSSWRTKSRAEEEEMSPGGIPPLSLIFFIFILLKPDHGGRSTAQKKTVFGSVHQSISKSAYACCGCDVAVKKRQKSSIWNRDGQMTKGWQAAPNEVNVIKPIQALIQAQPVWVFADYCSNIQTLAEKNLIIRFIESFCKCLICSSLQPLVPNKTRLQFKRKNKKKSRTYYKTTVNFF